MILTEQRFFLRKKRPPHIFRDLCHSSEKNYSKFYFLASFYKWFFRKILLFSKNLFNNKTSVMWFVIRKVIFDVWQGVWRCTHAKLAPLTLHPLARDRHYGPASGQRGGTLWGRQPFCPHFSSRKVILIFGLRRPLSLKNGQMHLQNSFFAVFSENTAFSEKIVKHENI